MAFLANFTAIDFETANRRRDSACQLAAVVVRDGQVVDEKMWMIRPDPFFFSPANIRIHGIHPADVRDQPSFGDQWAEIADLVVGDCLIAHNAPFDIGVLLGCLERHQCEIPALNFSCTRLIARQAWTDRGRYGLKPLADWLGVQFKHHDALEDSRACASILLAAGISAGADSIEDLERRLRIVRGKAGPWGVSQAARLGRTRKSAAGKGKIDKGVPQRTLRRGNRPSPALPVNPFDDEAMMREPRPGYAVGSHPVTLALDQSIDWQRLSVRAEFIQPLRGKRIVICGRLRVMTHEQAIEMTQRSGGVHQPNVDESTNCLVIGGSEIDQAKIQALAGRSEVQILSETQFLELIGL